jgi:2-oxoglutarate ferredoxin oxidoreductase subunit gamma
MKEEIIISGAGGQGIMFMGKLLAQAALKQGLNVTLLPAYGAEVRGGSSFCMVIISDEEIASPFVTLADTVVALNEVSFNKFKGKLKDKGLLILNSSLTENKPQLLKNKLVFLPFSETATQLGDIRIANMVSLGSYIAAKKIISLKSTVESLKEFIPANKKDMISLNEKALKEGIKKVEGQK